MANKAFELASKDGSTNMALGIPDIIIKEGHVQLIEDPKVQQQEVLKSCVSEMDIITGYGCAVQEFRGVKDTTVMRSGIIIRLMRSVSLLERWRSKKYEIQSIEASPDRDAIKLNITMSLGSVELSV